MAKEKKETEAEEKTDKKEKDIVIEETEDDVLSSDFSGDPEDFKNEVKKEAKKGRVARVLLPILFFTIIGGVVGFGTWYFKTQSEKEEPKNVEEKIQTPPEVTEEETVTEETAEEVKEETPATEETTTSSDYTVYTVKSGDTLSGIANEYDMTSQALADYNGITDVHSLQIGQKIKIPTN